LNDDGNASSIGFADSTIIHLHGILVSSDEARFDQSIADTVEVFSLYDLRIRKLAGNRLQGADNIINDTLYPSPKNGDTVRYTLRIINNGRRERIPQIIIADTMPAGLRLLDTVRSYGRTRPAAIRKTAADTVYTWTLNDITISVGDSIEFVYDAIFTVTPPHTALTNTAFLTHYKSGGGIAKNADPEFDVDSVIVNFAFNPDSLTASVFVRRGTMSSGKIDTAANRDANYMAYDGDTIIWGVVVTNRYEVEDRTAMNIIVRDTLLDTMYVRFLHNPGIPVQDTAIAVLAKGQSDTVYFYAIAIKHVSASAPIRDSVFVWSDEVQQTDKRRAGKELTGIGVGTVVNTKVERMPPPTTDGNYKEGAKVRYRITLSQTAGYQSAEQVVVRAELPPELSKTAVTSDTLRRSSTNRLPLLGGDTLFVLGKLYHSPTNNVNMVDTILTLYATIDSGVRKVLPFKIYHDAISNVRNDKDTTLNTAIDTVVPNPDDLILHIKPIITGAEDWYNAHDTLYARAYCAYAVEVRSEGTDTTHYHYTLTFTDFEGNTRLSITNLFTFAGKEVHNFTVSNIHPMRAGSFVNVARLTTGDDEDVVERTLKNNEVSDTLEVISRIDVAMGSPEVRVWNGADFVRPVSPQSPDSIMEGDTVRLQLTVANLRSTLHTVTVHTSPLSILPLGGLTFVSSINNRPPFNNECRWDAATKTLTWQDLTLGFMETRILQAKFVVDTIATANSFIAWQAWVDSVKDDLDRRNDTTAIDTLLVKRNPYDLSLTKTVSKSALNITETEKTFYYTIEVCNRRTETLWAQITDVIPAEFQASLQFDSIRHGTYSERINDGTMFKYPSAGASSAYPYELKLDPAAAGCDEIKVYCSVKGTAATDEFPYTNTAAAQAYKNNPLSENQKEATLAKQ
jgi:uncharacterized repeat protein (TIGR01451 family)